MYSVCHNNAHLNNKSAFIIIYIKKFKVCKKNITEVLGCIN